MNTMPTNLRCATIIEELAPDMCTIQRRISLRESLLAIVRDDSRRIVLRVTPIDEPRSGKMIIRSLGYVVTTFDLHKRFVSTGKATISVPSHPVRIMLSNCPPDRLRLFLANLRSKVRHTKTSVVKKPVTSDALPTSLSLLNEVSPLRLPLRPIDNNSPSTNSKESGPALTSTPVRPTLDRTYSHVTSTYSSENIRGADLQLQVVHFVKQGRNIFCTGGAGTGKSHLIRRIIGILPPDYTAVTASTGTAANLIGGTTVHAFSGIGDLFASDSNETKEASEAWLSSLRARLLSLPSVVSRWRKTRHLIIDEISMLSSWTLTRLELLALETRCPSEERTNIPPFGGIQVLVFGDFFQLPPVTKNGPTKFAFESPSWKRCNFTCIELSHSWRQSDDPVLARLLSSAREGICPEWAQSLLKSRLQSNISIDSRKKDDLTATRLCTHRADAEAWNSKMLSALKGEEKVYRAQDSNAKYERLLDTICPAPSELRLKVGAQVMLLRNVDTHRGLVNGARGVVERLGVDEGLPLVRFVVKKAASAGSASSNLLLAVQREKWSLRVGNFGQSEVYRRQLPLALAWAVSIHKSQGITLESAELALSKVFECGQAYVALSRCRTLSGLRLLDWRPDVIRANPKVIEFYRELRRNQEAGCTWKAMNADKVYMTSSPIKKCRR
ncbi:unnamed protein product [Dicrocoelium dendriticum]|nr:unnamed protein product [Dicrocoelium dendriticum]